MTRHHMCELVYTCSSFYVESQLLLSYNHITFFFFFFFLRRGGKKYILFVFFFFSLVCYLVFDGRGHRDWVSYLFLRPAFLKWSYTLYKKYAWGSTLKFVLLPVIVLNSKGILWINMLWIAQRILNSPSSCLFYIMNTCHSYVVCDWLSAKHMSWHLLFLCSISQDRAVATENTSFSGVLPFPCTGQRQCFCKHTRECCKTL